MIYAYKTQDIASCKTLTKNTNDRRCTAISTPEIYNNILYSLKETNSFEGHLIKGHMANYICIDSRVRSHWGAIANPHAKF